MVPSIHVSRAAGAAVFVWLCWAGQSAGVEYRAEVLARSGDAAPGLAGGVTYADLANVDIDNRGNVSFLGQVHGDVPGFWAAAPSDVHLGAVRDELIPGLSADIQFAGYRGAGARIHGGRLLIDGVIMESGEYRDAILLGPPGAMRIVAAEGMSAPGIEPAAEFHIFRDAQSVNNTGEVLLAAQLNRGGTSVPEAGLWVGAADGLELIARSGSRPPGLPDGVAFSPSGDQSDFSPFGTWMLNEGGEVAFTGMFDGPGVGPADNSGLWLGDRHDPQLVLRKGDDVQVGDADYRFGDPAIVDFNDHGSAVVWSLMLGADGSTDVAGRGLWVVDSQRPRPIIHVGDAVPGDSPGVTVSDVRFQATINNDGHVAFSIRESDGDGSLWMTSDAGLVRILGTGDRVRGQYGDEVVVSVGNMHGTINDRGQVLLGSVRTDRGYGYWVRDVDGTLLSVAAQGDFMDLGDGVPRIIDAFWHHNHNFNDMGQVAMAVGFSDGTTAVVRYSLVPEPSAWTMLLIGIGCCAAFGGLKWRRGRAPCGQCP